MHNIYDKKLKNQSKMSNEIRSVPLNLVPEQNSNCSDADNKEQGQLQRCEQKVSYINSQSKEAVQQSKKRKSCEMDGTEESYIQGQLRNKI